jgi:NarL family two-component system response regulator LiaR
LTPIRVLIADDHAVVRQGLRTFLELQDDVAVVADVADGAAAIAAAREHRPDVVLMDLVMPGIDGVEAIRAIRRERPATRVIALTSFLDDDKVLPAVRAGAAAYLLKDVGPQDLVAAIRTVYGGEALLHPAVAARLMEEVAAAQPRDAPEHGLTPREREVLAMVAEGATNREIGERLFMAEKTASVHVSRILAKLDVRSRTEAAAVAHRLGLDQSVVA